MNFAVWVFFFFTLAFFICDSLQSEPVCYGNTCPYGTSRCKKHIKSNGDGYMWITIDCLDDDDGVLKTYYYKEPATINQYTKYESTSYKSIEGGFPNRFIRYQGLNNNDVEQFL